MTKPVHLTGLTQAEMISVFSSMGEKPFRGKQVFNAVFKRRVRSLDEILELPLSTRNKLRGRVSAATLTVEEKYVSIDGTRRFLLKTHDNQAIETVFIPDERRDTICFSSQAGCALDCAFCLTATLGLKRSLTAGEIVEQIVIALNDVYGPGAELPHGTNLVAMGAGEPLLNFDELMGAIRIMADPKGMHIVPNRVTVSTAGIVPKIIELATVTDRPHLAVSLTAANDKLRSALMPINNRWPLKDLMQACKQFAAALKPGETLTFEYVLLQGINDSDAQALELAKLLNKSGLNCKVNLIAFNPAEPLTYRASTPERVAGFRARLAEKRIDSYLRRPRGQDILAACGQLAARRLQSAVAPLGISPVASIGPG